MVTSSLASGNCHQRGKNEITISKIVVPKDERGNGIGSKAMQSLTDYADSIGKRVVLTPATDFGGSKPRLVKFYKRFGFTENKGRNRDFTTREGMIREPLNKPLAAQTETPAFKKWFGDSKVVDAKGKPLVVYHITKAAFDTFREGKPIFVGFSEGRAGAAALAAGRTMNLYARAERPANTPDSPVHFLDVSKAFRDNPGSDSVYVQDEGGLSLALRSPSQLKSATDNRGTFNPDDARIDFALAGGVFARASVIGRQNPKAESSDPFAAENARIRESHKTLWDAAKRTTARYLKPGGLLQSEVFDADQVRNANLRGVAIEAQYRIHELERAVKADYGKPITQIGDAELAKLRNGLVGDLDDSLPVATKRALVAMRQYLDAQSREYVAILGQQVRDKIKANPDAEASELGLVDTITQNMGRWVHRSYRCFDDPKWHTKVQPATINAARVFLRREYREAGMSEADAATRAERAINEILKTGTAYGDMGSFISQSKLGAKDLSVLMKRKNVPPAIRALMGEYVDPRVNFAKSTAKMGALIANSHFLNGVREIGMGKFLFDEHNRPPEATVQLAGDKSATYAPLNGLWVTPETAQAFEDALGDHSPDGLYKWAVAANGFVNYSKTVLSPTTAMRNIQSSFFFTVANGHFNLAKGKEALSAVKAEFGKDRAAAQRYIEKLTRLGVTGDGTHEGDFRQYLESSGIKRFFDGDTAIGKANALAQNFYRFGDDFWKIIGFENEKAALMSAGMTEDAADKEAAERIRNTYPTYSKAPKLVKALARSPILGSFPTFSAEVIRTSYHLIQYARKDMQSKNPAMRANGIRRALGFAAVNAAITAAWLLSMSAFGVDDDDDEAVRELAPPWQKNSMFLYMGRDGKGNLRYFDLTFLDPYGLFKRPLVAAARDEPWQDRFKSASVDMLSPFLGADIAIQAVGEIAFNKKLSTGGPVYRAGEESEDIANYLRRAVQPGFASNIERWIKALRNEKRPGGAGEYSESDEAAAMLGWRMTTMQPRTALYYRSFDFRDEKQSAGSYLRRVLSDPNKVSSEDIRDARKTAMDLHRKAFVDMARVVDAARNSGMNNQQIFAVLRASGISGVDSFALVNGRVPAFGLSVQSLKSAAIRAKAVGDDELADEIPGRYVEAAGD